MQVHCTNFKAIDQEVNVTDDNSWINDWTEEELETIKFIRYAFR
jgi:hypothetical protein